MNERRINFIAIFVYFGSILGHLCNPSKWKSKCCFSFYNTILKSFVLCLRRVNPTFTYFCDPYFDFCEIRSDLILTHQFASQSVWYVCVTIYFFVVVIIISVRVYPLLTIRELCFEQTTQHYMWHKCLLAFAETLFTFILVVPLNWIARNVFLN